MMGAGIIVVKWVGSWKVLALEAPAYIKNKNNGKYDIPKGQIDPGENAWQTAVREAYEEASLILGHQEVIFGPMKDKWLTVWICEVPDSENIDILPNPDTNIYEHESFHWLSFAEMANDCYSYLKPFITRAEQTLQTHSTLYTT